MIKRFWITGEINALGGACVLVRAYVPPKGMNIQGDIMYKVAIVDDEPVIVRGLTKMIPWGKAITAG